MLFLQLSAKRTSHMHTHTHTLLQIHTHTQRAEYQ